MTPLVIGITGTLGAGKGTIVEYLVQKAGFGHYSVRAFLIKAIQARGLDINRDSMTLVANEIRRKLGPSYITDCLLEAAQQSGKPGVIESIRAVGEIESLRRYPRFSLWAVDADLRLRYDRIHLRGSETDHIDFTTFVNNEQREMHTEDPSKQNLAACIRLADHTFMNNGSISELEYQVQSILQNIH